jgi:hypothetical protein
MVQKLFSHPEMTIHTPIYSPCRDDKKCTVCKFFEGILGLKKPKNSVKIRTVNSLSKTPGEYSERSRWNGSCNSPLGFLTIVHDILYFGINVS